MLVSMMANWNSASGMLQHFFCYYFSSRDSVKMPERLPFLCNSYRVLRHGKSIPNKKGLIVSSVENGTLEKYGLAFKGVDQERLAGELLLEILFMPELEEKNIPLETLQIFCSSFSRTTRTAKEVANVLGIPFESPQCKVMLELRERFFGPPFELFSDEKYSEIWALDEKDPFMPPEGGESVADVASRIATAVETIEADFQGCTILVVSPGDPLQILQTILHAAKEHASSNGEDILSSIKGVMVHSILSQHRKFALNTGELRHVI